jgi:hypothetical protein
LGARWEGKGEAWSPIRRQLLKSSCQDGGGRNKKRPNSASVFKIE